MRSSRHDTHHLLLLVGTKILHGENPLQGVNRTIKRPAARFFGTRSVSGIQILSIGVLNRHTPQGAGRVPASGCPRTPTSTPAVIRAKTHLDRPKCWFLGEGGPIRAHATPGLWGWGGWGLGIRRAWARVRVRGYTRARTRVCAYCRRFPPGMEDALTVRTRGRTRERGSAAPGTRTAPINPDA